MPSFASTLSKPSSLQVAPPARDEAPRADASTRRALLPVSILGVPFDPMTIASAVERIEAMIAARTPHFVVTPNVDFLVQARRDSELHQILTEADLVLCDGKPLVWASQWLGNVLPGRVAGSDLVPVLLKRAAECGWKIFLLGGAEGVGAAAAQRIAADHPTLPPVAHYSPPHRPLDEMNHTEIIAQVRRAQPDIVLVCFGCPKQEKWIIRHYRTVGAPVMIGAGGTVDFLAGRLKRAPRWMRYTGTESVFRLAQEPRRLLKRYVNDLFQFVPALLNQLWHMPAKNSGRDVAQPAPSSAATSYGINVHASGALHRDTLQTSPQFWAKAMDQSGHCLLDMEAVKSIDSTGLAFLAHWQRQLASVKRNLILYRPGVEVRAALARMHLTEKFVITDRLSPAQSTVLAASRANATAGPNGST